MSFSVQIINLVKEFKSKHETVISNQIGRSGTSIGANIYEANYAQGKKDFISKPEIAWKEASETGYWLESLAETAVGYAAGAVSHLTTDDDGTHRMVRLNDLSYLAEDG